MSLKIQTFIDFGEASLFVQSVESVCASEYSKLSFITTARGFLDERSLI
jgi:hypothetical protein